MPGDGGMRRFVAGLAGDGKGIDGNAGTTGTIALEAAVEDGSVIAIWGRRVAPGSSYASSVKRRNMMFNGLLSQ